MYNGCFVCFKSRSAPFFLVECFIDNCFNAFPVALGGWPGHLYGKIIHERHRSALAVDLALYEVDVSIEEEE